MPRKFPSRNAIYMPSSTKPRTVPDMTRAAEKPLPSHIGEATFEAPQIFALPPYVTVRVASEVTGLSEKAIRVKIDRGVWREGKEYRRGPDARIYVSLMGYQQWVESA